MNLNKTILITGGAGYLGSVITPLLLERGYKVIILDRFFFGKDSLSAHAENPQCQLIEGDIRSIKKELLQNIYAIFDFAAIANDPAAELDPKITYEINWKGRARLAVLAKKAKVSRYILASSCSVYGFQNKLLDEKARTSPLTTYAKSTLLAEKSILPLSDNNFATTALRQGTLYGPSPRMRFDLVINTMTLNIFKNNKLLISGGEQWRPLLHVEDSAKAFINILEADPHLITKEIFNVGGSSHNFQIIKLAKQLANEFSLSKKDITITNNNDSRSYRVSCQKIENKLGWKQHHQIKESAKTIYEKLSSKELVGDIKTKTLEWYKELLKQNPNILKDSRM